MSNGNVRGATFFATLDGSARRHLFDSLNGSLRYVANPRGAGGWVAYTAENQLLLRPFDANTGAVTGAPRLLAAPVSNGPFFSFSNTGMLAYHQPPTPHASLQWYSRSGQPGATVGEPGSFGRPSLSPDAGSIAFRVQSGAVSDLVVQDLATTNRRRIDAMSGTEVVWTPDGHLLFSRRVDASGGQTHELVERSLSGGDDRVLARGYQGGLRVMSLSADGSKVSFSMGGGGTRESFLVSRPGGAVRRTGRGSRMLSPDGNWAATTVSGESQLTLAAVSDESAPVGREVSSVTFPESPTAVRWSHDGRQIYALADAMYSLPVEWVNGAPRLGLPRKLFDLKDATGFDVAADGQRFLVLRSAEAPGTAPRLVVVQNWPKLLER